MGSCCLPFQWRIQGRSLEGPPAYFSTKLRPEGLKKFFSRPGPLLSQGQAPNKKHVGVYVCMYL